jgi:hypothetical protein
MQFGSTSRQRKRRLTINLDHISDFSHLIDTQSDRLSNLLEIERREYTGEDVRVIEHFALHILQETKTAGTEGSDDCIMKEIGAFWLRLD